jgi:hypothetical protein
MLLFPCIYLVFFGGIWAFQRVMTNPNQFFLARLAGGPLCATALAVLVAPAREPLLTLSFMREPFYPRFRPSGSFCLKIYHSVPLSGPGAHRRPAFVIYRGLDGASQRLEAVNLLHFGKNNDPGRGRRRRHRWRPAWAPGALDRSSPPDPPRADKGQENGPAHC